MTMELDSRWQTLAAVDADRWACATYAANFPAVSVWQSTVADALADLPAADVLLGGPPCQSFSTAGNGDGETDERNAWPDMIEAVRVIRPRMFLAENVPGMLARKHLPYTRSVFADLEAPGYVVETRLLDAVDYGVPQFRKRLWWWGVRADVYAAGVRQAWPAPTHCWPPPEPGLFGASPLRAGVTVGQALGIEGWYDAQNETMHGDEPCGTLQANAQAKGGRAGHYAVQLEYQGHDDLNAPAPTMRSGSVPGCSDIVITKRQWSDQTARKHPVNQTDAPGRTQRAASLASGQQLVAIRRFRGGGVVRRDHPLSEPYADRVFVRRLLPLECARLQSCPDDMAWPEGITKTAQYRVVGNGWACGIAAHLSRALADADPDSRTVVDLFCGGGLGALGWHGRCWEWLE